LTNTAAVSGGGEINTANNAASDPTLIAIEIVAPRQIPTLSGAVLALLLLFVAVTGAISLRARRGGNRPIA
jgi:hypothetical protein